MNIVANILVGFVAVAHIGFLYLEMFLWNTPKGHKIFKLDPSFAEQSATLASNQGLYNGFLAAGLIWAMVHSNVTTSFQLKVFFLSCVVIAGAYGWMTVSKTILYVQLIPALLALALVFISSR